MCNDDLTRAQSCSKRHSLCPNFQLFFFILLTFYSINPAM